MKVSASPRVRSPGTVPAARSACRTAVPFAPGALSSTRAAPRRRRGRRSPGHGLRPAPAVAGAARPAPPDALGPLGAGADVGGDQRSTGSRGACSPRRVHRAHRTGPGASRPTPRRHPQRDKRQAAHHDPHPGQCGGGPEASASTTANRTSPSSASAALNQPVSATTSDLPGVHPLPVLPRRIGALVDHGAPLLRGGEHGETGRERHGEGHEGQHRNAHGDHLPAQRGAHLDQIALQETVEGDDHVGDPEDDHAEARGGRGPPRSTRRGR